MVGAGPSRENRDTTKKAFEDYFNKKGITQSILDLDFDDADENCQETIEEAILNNQIMAACALNSRSTRVLCEALKNTNRYGYFPVIGNGLFEGSKQYLREGVLTAIVHKQPYEQCIRALNVMTDYLIRDIRPAEDTVNVNIEIAFKSTVDQFNTEI